MVTSTLPLLSFDAPVVLPQPLRVGNYVYATVLGLGVNHPVRARVERIEAQADCFWIITADLADAGTRVVIGGHAIERVEVAA